MGDDALPDAPRREVTVSAFTMDRSEVSVGAFEQFAAGPGWTDDRCWSPDGRVWRDAHPQGAGPTSRASFRDAGHPVVAVTFWEAEAYCACSGGSLPTEAQWERAACGTNPSPEPPPTTPDDTRSLDGEGALAQISGVRTGPTTAAGQHPNMLGLLHMYGNVWEWTRDAYHATGYQRLGPIDPVGTDGTPWRTLRGGSYMSRLAEVTCTHREPARPDEPRLTVGFRCVYPP